MTKKRIIIKIIVIAVIVGVFYFFYGNKTPRVKFSVIKCPANVTLSADSANYTGRTQYTVYASVANNTAKPLVYMPLFGLIKDKEGRQIGLAMGNTGRILKAGDKALITLDTVIPKELGTPASIELYSE